MNLACILKRARSHYANKPVCLFRDEAVSFQDFSRQVTKLSATLRRMGGKKNSHIALLASNRPELIVSLFSIWAIGGIAIPINPALTLHEVGKIIDHCEPTIVITELSLSNLLCNASVNFKILEIDAQNEISSLTDTASLDFEIADVEPVDPALIYYTSGTTGMPKGAVLSHSAVIATADMFSQHLQIGPSDRLLVTGPMTFILHLTMNALTAISGGASFIILEKFRPDATLEAINHHQITVLIAVPTVYAMMANFLNEQTTSFPSVRLSISAGAAFPAALSKRIHHQLGIRVFDLWGMTECGPITSYDPATDAAGRPDSCGRPLPSCQIRIVNDGFQDLEVGGVGEVLLRCPGLMNGYYKNTEATDEVLVDGWMRSGDLGKIDKDGYLYIVGRKKDMIIRGGANIYPVDVEEVLYSHLAVGECAVVGIPDDTLGETVKAFVVLREGMRADCSQLIDYCRSKIAEYKAPSQIEIVSALPKGSTGKILRRELRDVSSPSPS